MVAQPLVTATTQARLAEVRMERYFDIDAGLYDDAARTEFVNEIFHHALRIAPERTRRTDSRIAPSEAI